MTERIQPSSLQLSRHQLEIVDSISEQAIKDMDMSFGRGALEAERPLLGEGLPYHNGHHARFVGAAAFKMARAVGFSHSEAKIAQLAGHAHDVVQGKDHEVGSAAWLEDKLRQNKKFPKVVAEMASLAIVGTTPVMESGRVVGQLATSQDYSSQDAEKIALAVACADLGDIYMPQGPLLAHELYREITKGEAIDDALVRFQRNQLMFLDRHAYPLQEANSLLATHKSEVIQHQQQLLERLEQGDVEDWQQVIQHDRSFYQQHQT